MSFNVQGCQAGLGTVASAVAAQRPDVACLQEVPRRAARSLARRLGLHVAGSGPLLGPRFGNPILSVDPVVHARARRLPRTPGASPRSFTLARTAGLTVAAVHLGLQWQERVKHARLVAAVLPPDGPLIVAGDLNEDPSGGAGRTLGAGLVDVALATRSAHATWPAEAPRARIDAIFVRGFRVEACRVVDTQASDHLAVVADLAPA